MLLGALLALSQGHSVLGTWDDLSLPHTHTRFVFRQDRSFYRTTATGSVEIGSYSAIGGDLALRFLYAVEHRKRRPENWHMEARIKWISPSQFQTIEIGPDAGEKDVFSFVSPSQVPPKLTYDKVDPLSDRAYRYELTLEDALKNFRLDCDRYPTTKEGLGALEDPPEALQEKWKGPYLDHAIERDPWGHRYIYHRSEEQDPDSFTITSYGPAGKPGPHAIVDKVG